MKILHIIENVQIAAGTTTFAVRCAEEQRRQGHQVAIVTRAYGREGIDIQTEVPVVVWDSKSPLHLLFDPEVVHIHGLWNPWALRGFHWAYAHHLPVVVSTHGALTPWSFNHKWWKKYPVWWLFQKRYLKKATMLHSTAPMETQVLRNLGFIQPIVEAPLGTEVPSEIAPHNHPVKFVSFLGRIYPTKGLALLIQTWAKLKAETSGFDWHFVAIGPDNWGHMGELKALAQSLGLTVGDQMDGSTDIVFTGAVYGEKKFELLRQTRLFILPSEGENFGVVIIDALAQGIPALTTTNAPWEGMMTHGCGELFERTEEGELQILTKWLGFSDEERRAAGLRGREWMTQAFSWPAIAQQMLKAYEALVK